MTAYSPSGTSRSVKEPSMAVRAITSPARPASEFFDERTRRTKAPRAGARVSEQVTVPWTMPGGARWMVVCGAGLGAGAESCAKREAELRARTDRSFGRMVGIVYATVAFCGISFR